MLANIILGTANFTQAYGVLADKTLVVPSDVCAILSHAHANEICVLDTAIGYGDLTQVVEKSILKKFKLITKISILDDEAQLVEKMQIYKGLRIYGLLIHDPYNVKYVEPALVYSRLEFLRSQYAIEKIGVSAYDISDIENFRAIFPPELIQIPLNPLNQSFDTPSFIEYVQTQKIEVHGRSLFLQGLLLADRLPKKLEDLHDVWIAAKRTLEPYDSFLYGLFLWASKKQWIHSWVLGVTSLRDLQEIVRTVCTEYTEREAPVFLPVNHPLIDPRRWGAL